MKTLEKEANEVYRAVVQDVIEGEVTEPFETCRIDNKKIKIIFEEFFKNAKYHIRLLCYNFPENIYEGKKIQKQLLKTISKGVKIQIIIIAEKPQTFEFAKTLAQNGVTFKTLYKQNILLSDDCKFTQNFIVIDKLMYIFNHNYNLPICSEACANAPKLCKQLVDLYDKLDDIATPIDIV